MGFINDNLGILYLGVATAIYLRPELAVIGGSRAATTLLGLLAVVAWKIVYALALYPMFFTPLKHIPTPGNRSLLCGNAETYYPKTPWPALKDWAENLSNEGLIRYYMVGNLERVFLTSPKALSELLVTKNYDFEKPLLVRQTLSRVVGNGILLAEGEEHKIQRKNLMPAFAYRHIKDLYPVFWSKGAEMVNLIQEDLERRKSAGEEDITINVRNWASRATLDIIGVAGMDHDFDSLRDPTNKLSRSYQQIFTSPGPGAKAMFLIGALMGSVRLLHMLPTERNKRIGEGGQVIRDVARQMIRMKREKMKNSTASTGVDIISVAMQSGVMDEENLVDQLMTFLGAGHETTASAMQWAVYALCKNPEIQTKLREEIRAHLPPLSKDSPNTIDASIIDGLPYLHAVCNEVLRFHPSVPGTIRTAVRDTSLAGTPIPKGTVLTIAPEVVNHLEEFWGPDAHKFNPERFMGPGKANTGGATSNYAFLTFLHGPRSCIGQGFAKAELACLLAVTVGRFHIELRYPDRKLELREGATVAPEDGVPAIFTPIEGW
ncbi:Cytochrome P450 monooxygenase [Penicillium ucsense]|uniref:Cytochrome P450 monooxygenase n=1 Tax=Penicillium ucsense TaxID=2839758 RepID=A0A8J8W238_9EURO|nr:Cytochrome P450 monooxygenase [Penicillium ucsense]KAF7732188.1 Cytochrome P450 monooxygenase [Penicillium ucsense]